MPYQSTTHSLDSSSLYGPAASPLDRGPGAEAYALDVTTRGPATVDEMSSRRVPASRSVDVGLELSNGRHAVLRLDRVGARALADRLAAAEESYRREDLAIWLKLPEVVAAIRRLVGDDLSESLRGRCTVQDISRELPESLPGEVRYFFAAQVTNQDLWEVVEDPNWSWT